MRLVIAFKGIVPPAPGLHSEQNSVTLVFAHISQNLKADLDRQGLNEVIGPNRQFDTLRECLAAYESSAKGGLKPSP
jgi:hypothetical protein